jgi:hypothetical protein
MMPLSIKEIQIFSKSKHIGAQVLQILVRKSTPSFATNKCTLVGADFGGAGRRGGGPAFSGRFGGRSGCEGRHGDWIGELAFCDSRIYVLDPYLGIRRTPHSVAVGGVRGALLRRAWFGSSGAARLQPREARVVAVEFTELLGLVLAAAVAPVRQWRCCRTRGVCSWGAGWWRFGLRLAVWPRGGGGSSAPGESLTALRLWMSTSSLGGGR